MAVRIKLSLENGGISGFGNDIRNRVTEVVRASVMKAGRDVATEARRAGGEGKSGVQYPRLPRRSAARGQAPASQTGALYGSIRQKLIDGGMSVEVGPEAFYGHILEAKGYAFMEPALTKVADSFAADLRRKLEAL